MRVSTETRRSRQLLRLVMGDPAQGKRVREARKGLGLTQEEFADLVGLGSGQSVSKIERGITQLTPRRARIIAEHSGKPISFFLDVTARTPVASDDGETAELFRQAVALLEEIRRRLPPVP